MQFKICFHVTTFAQYVQVLFTKNSYLFKKGTQIFLPAYPFINNYFVLTFITALLVTFPAASLTSI